jgi:4-hydroxyphenylpyruvate dioxygenase
LLARLKARNILYDRDAGGEFFQLFGRRFDDGLFLAIVEHRGAYQGYGAPQRSLPHCCAEALAQAGEPTHVQGR